MAGSKKIKDFFNDRYFEIPKYQRGFAWEKRHVRDLFGDIKESIETHSDHYLGTFVLSKSKSDEDRYFVVDGQQRITTITMIINEIIKRLGDEDRFWYYRFYIKDEGVFKLIPHGRDRTFFEKLLNEEILPCQSKSQRLLKDAFEEINNQLMAIDDKQRFLKYLQKLEVMEFIEESEGDAIRIFQTVNDRGKPLSNMEKAKSLLIYFSNRYLKKELDDYVNDLFGEIFEYYDDIKLIAEDLGIKLLSKSDFNEDNIMRYHFITFDPESYDPTAQEALNILKLKLEEFRNGIEIKALEMKKYIEVYSTSLRDFFKTLKGIIERSYSNPKYYKAFVMLGMSATLYPLLVKLEMLGKLETPLPSDKLNKHTIMDLLENIDVRVYKTRGTDPRAEISRFAYEVDDAYTDGAIFAFLTDFNKRWMSHDQFTGSLMTNIYGNAALVHIFIDYCETINGKVYTVDELLGLVRDNPTIEHILSQTPRFTYKSYNFKNEKEYMEHDGQLGNLTLLEKDLNSAVQNKNPFEKVSYYDRSKFPMAKRVAAEIAGRGYFRKENILDRTNALYEYFISRWWS